ncbi:MAG: helix-turn-helix transcriptional regulator [Clostridia bacterium]|nr:helix-turn-helix transcriptional regulator [Clostridia bacterium]
MIEGFGERLKAFLKARKITLAVCEQKTGISKKTLGSYINGSVNPSAMAIIRLAKGLNVSADWLLCLSDEIKRAPEKPKNVKASENLKPQVITKTVIASENMTQQELETLVCSYTGLTRQAVRGLHNSRGFQLRWIRSE